MKTTFERISGAHDSTNAYTTTIISNVRLAIVDCRYTIVWVNDKFCQLTQFEKEELVGRSINQLHIICPRPEDFMEIQSVISAGQPWSGEIKTKAKDDTNLWVKVNILPVKNPNGRIESYLIFVTDITATKLAFEKEKNALHNMRKSEARYKAVVENQSDIMSLCLVDGTRIFVNQEFCRFVGKEENELVGRRFSDFPIKGLPVNVYDRMSELTLETPEASGMFELEDASGRKVWTLLNFKGIFDLDGKLYEILTIGRDVTDLKLAELNKSNYIIELERIAFITSHNLRGPIAQIQGFLELLRINAIHSKEWTFVLDQFKQSIANLDLCTRELGAFIYQSQESK